MNHPEKGGFAALVWFFNQWEHGSHLVLNLARAERAPLYYYSRFTFMKVLNFFSSDAIVKVEIKVWHLVYMKPSILSPYNLTLWLSKYMV